MFDYRIDKNGAVITGCGSSEEILIVPEMIEEKPVAAIDSRAFYGMKQLIKVSLPDSVQSIGDYAFAECRKLEHVKMPESLIKIGDYAFYNCHALKSIVLPPDLSSMGYGAFKNCSELKKVSLFADEGQRLAIGALIDDSSNEIEIHMHDRAGKLLTKLIFTEFEYDCIIQVEARQFDWVYHGSGNVYRECISDNGVDYHKYDGVFNAAVREDWPQTAMRIALGRVLYPYKLLNEHRKIYTDYLTCHKDAVFEWILKQRDTEALEKCADFLADSKSVDSWILKAKDAQVPEFVSFLMDYKNRHYGVREKQFEL